MSEWKQLAKEVLIETPWFRVSRDRYGIPGGRTGEYTYVDIPGSTMVVPVLEDGHLVMVRQHRYLMGRSSLEFPAGGMKRGFTPLQNAKAELGEETGYEAERWTRIGGFAPYNGVSNETCHVFVAEGLRAGPARPEETEDVEVVLLELEEVKQGIVTGEQWDGMSIASLAFYEAWRAEPRAS